MPRFAVPTVILVLALAFSMVDCGGGSSTTTGPPASITVSPSPLSMTQGQKAPLTVQVEDAAGHLLTGQTIAYDSSNSTVASVSTTGVVCAGAWDSLTNPAVCNVSKDAQGNPLSGAAVISVTTGGLTPVSVTVYVHPNVDSIAITPNSLACQSQGSTSTFTAIACNGNGAGSGGCIKGSPITSSVGPFTWVVTPATVATTDITGNTCTFTNTTCATGSSCNTCQITAALPGQASISASVASTAGAPVSFTTCPVQSISLTDANGRSSTSLSTGGTMSLTANAVDTNGMSLPLSNLLLTYSSSQPQSSAAGSTVIGGMPGSSTIVASCTPPSCNTGMYPIYSNPYQVTVGGSTTTTVYAASKSGTTLVPINTSTNTAGAPITLPYPPNSMLINTTGTAVVLGSSTNAMVYNISGNSVSATGFAGTVLAISPDGNTAIFANPGIVYIYSLTGANLLADFPMTAPAHAAFSPDSYRAYVVGGNQLAAWSPGATPQILSLSGAANDVDFLAQGSFGYLAGGGTGNISVYATCDPSAALAGVATPTGTVPTLIRAVPNGTQMVAADSPNIDLIAASAPTPVGAGCPPTISNAASNASFANVSSFAANQLLVAPDSSKAFILASNQKAVLVYDVTGKTSPPTSAIPLAGGATPTTGGVTLDSAFLYVGASDGNVHQINVSTGTDVAQISPGFTPDLVAVAP